MTISQKSLVITSACMFFMAATTFLVNLDNYQQALQQENFQEEEILVEITPPEQELLYEQAIEDSQDKKKNREEGFQMTLETHSAFNEQQDDQEEVEKKPLDKEVMDAIQNSKNYVLDEYSNEAKDILTMSQKDLLESEEFLARVNDQLEEIKGNRRNTTVKYDLKGRSSIAIPTPAYTCENKGVVVVDIMVDDRGRVIDAKINRTQSSQEDGCLEKNAIAYAMQALFEPSLKSEIQKGVITFFYQD